MAIEIRRDICKIWEFQKINPCMYLSTIIVVEDVPSMQMETMYLRRLTGISPRSEKSVSFQDFSQSLMFPVYLVKPNRASHLKIQKKSEEEILSKKIQVKLINSPIT